MKYDIQFTLLRAVSSLVVSPPISTVIPIILLVTADTSFRKKGHKKAQISPGMKKAPTISN